MPDSQLPTPADSSDALTLVEKLVEVRLLVLTLAFLFYLDIWALRAKIDPMAFTAEQLGKHLQAIPVFELALFFASFSILMGAFFPAVRHIGQALYLLFGGSSRFRRTNRDLGAKRLSNWALGMIAFSSYDLVLGSFGEGSYRGLAWYLAHLLENNSFELVVFRLTCMLFWLVCLAIACELDN